MMTRAIANPEPCSQPRELWRPIPGYEQKYHISDRGRIMIVRYKGSPVSKIKKLGPDKDGYPRTTLYANGYKNYRVHRLVLLAFIGACPSGAEAAHLDGDPNNNALSNLAYISHRENIHHRIGHGTAPIGERCPWAALNEQSVREIREFCIPHSRVHGVSAMARKFGVSRRAIQFARNRRNWKCTE